MPGRLTCVLFLTGLVAAQESRPASRPEAGPRREGGFLGLYLTETPWSGRRALQVQSVHPGSDAEQVGFRAGDRIVAVNGRPIDGGDEFIRAVWVPPLGRRRGHDTMTVLREGKELVIAAGLYELDAHPTVGDPAPDFTLKSADGTRAWALKEHLGSRPVVLVFGSFT